MTNVRRIAVSLVLLAWWRPPRFGPTDRSSERSPERSRTSRAARFRASRSKSTSNEKGFQRTTTTDSSGAFTVALLAAREPTRSRSTISGFESYVSSGDVDRRPRRRPTSPSPSSSRGAGSRWTVVGDVPLVDKTNIGRHDDGAGGADRQACRWPRRTRTVVDFAPGQNDIDGDGNPNARGAPDSGNVFLFDGVDTTDPTTGTFGANNNFDTIQEVVVSNANVSAEYGRVQGGVFNVITKSGTNFFHGTGRVLVTNDSWNADNKGINPLSGNPFNRDQVRREHLRLPLHARRAGRGRTGPLVLRRVRAQPADRRPSSRPRPRRCIRTAPASATSATVSTRPGRASCPARSRRRTR